MLQTGLLYYIELLLKIYSYIHLYISHLYLIVVFYPKGLVATIVTLILLFFVFIKLIILIRKIFNNFCYNVTFIVSFFELVSLYGKYFLILFEHFFFFIGDILKIYSIYKLIFHFKRIEFYLFIFFILLIYC